MKEYMIKVHEIAVDGYPPREGDPREMETVCRIAFLFDGCIVSGWPLHKDEHPDFYTPEKIEQRATGGRGGAGMTLDQRRKLAADVHWVADEDVGHHRPFAGVTHWVEFPTELYNIERGEG